MKPRDFEPCQPFEIEGRPHLDRTGQFAMVAEPGMAEAPKRSVERLNERQLKQEEARLMLAAGHSAPAIAKQVGVSEKTIDRWKSQGVLDVPGTSKAPISQPAREELQFSVSGMDTD